MRLTLDQGAIDLDRRVVRRGSDEVGLTTTEARLLAHMARHPGRVFGRDELQVEVWGYRAGIESRTVFTTIGRVRQKIEEDPSKPTVLVSVPGGYRLLLPRAAADVRASLPAPPTPFVGRERELAALERMVAGGDRLVAVLGPGGIGKTRLAIELARRQASRFADGAAFVALEAVETADGLARALLAALCADPLAPGEDPARGLVDRLRGREQLVVCDNAEQITKAAELLAAVVAGAPRVTLIVTTRVRLALACEAAFVLDPMEAPSSGATLDRTDGGQLVLSQARRARPEWEPDAAERGELARLVGLTQGSPLAIELAAAWLRLLDPSEVVRELERGADLLRTDSSDVPARHTSVRSTMEASFRLLADESVRSLAELAVLRGSFTRDAASALAGAGLRELGQLVDASMIRRVGGGRFAFHPAVRAVALTRLDPGARATLEQRHARYFASLLRGSYLALERGAGLESGWLEQLSGDHLDLVAAFDRMIAARDAEALGDMAEAFYRYLDGRNRFVELADAWSRAKAVLADEPRATARDRALGLLIALEQGAGWAMGDDGTGRELLTPLGGECLVFGLIGSAIAALLKGRVDESVRFGAEAVQRAERIARPWPLGFALSVHASAAARAGELALARAHLERAVAISAARRGRGHCRPLVHLGEVFLQMRDLEPAAATLEDALTACREADDKSFAVLAQWRLGEARAALGVDPEPAFAESVEEACAHHVPPYWWRGAVIGLAELRGGDATRAGAALTALACLTRALPIVGAERDQVERARCRARERVGAAAAVGFEDAAGASDLERAALALIEA